jgi:hypothetical protein
LERRWWARSDDLTLGTSDRLDRRLWYPSDAGLGKESPMTIEAAVFAAGSILITALIWQTHRLTTRRLGEIHNDLDALKNLVSRLFVMGLNRKPEETAVSGTESAATQSDLAETKQTPVPTLELAPELAEVDELCAKLITLAPPKEALPLLSEPTQRADGSRKRLRP